MPGFFDYSEVSKFKLSFPRKGTTIVCWESIFIKFRILEELEICVGFIHDPDEFCQYLPVPLRRFSLSLYGSGEHSTEELVAYKESLLVTTNATAKIESCRITLVKE